MRNAVVTPNRREGAHFFIADVECVSGSPHGEQREEHVCVDFDRVRPSPMKGGSGRMFLRVYLLHASLAFPGRSGLMCVYEERVPAFLHGEGRGHMYECI